MAVPKQPTVRLVFHLEKVPAESGTDTYRWATEPLADVQFSEGRIKQDSFGEIVHQLSSHDGHYAGASVRCVLDDQDGAIGALLGAEDTQYFIGRDATLELLSVAGRAADLEWRPLFHGRVADAQPGAGRTVTFEVRDLLSSEFAGLSLDRPVGRTLIKASEHPDCPASALNTMYPIVIGEHSDKGTIDADGNEAEQGTLPVKFVGYRRIRNDGELGGEGGPVYMGPPLNVIGTVVGAGGSRTLYYSVSAITETGETIASGIAEVASAPDLLTASDYVALTWSPPALYGDQVLRWRINGREANPPTRYVGLTADATAAFNDQGQDGENLPTSPEVSNAIVDTPTGDGGTELAWGKLLLALGAVKPSALFVSNLGGEDEARAAAGRKAYSLESEDVLSPYLDNGDVNPTWPYDDPWIEINGIRATYILLKGPRLQEHLDGKVTIAWNGCGYDASGDWDGPVVDQPGEAIPLFINEFLLKNGGEGYRGGSFGPLEEFPDGVPMINTASFDACQALSATWMGTSKGYLCQWYIDDTATSVRQVLQWLAMTFGWFFTAADFGQIFAVCIDDTGDLEGAAAYREDIEIIDAELPPAEIRYSDIENRITYQFHFMPDQKKYRSQVKTISDEDARDALRGTWHESGTIDLRCSNDRATCEDAMARRLLRRKYPAVYQTWSTGMAGIEQAFTPQPVLVTHTGGGRGGYAAHPMFVMQRVFDPNTFHVRLQGMSVKRLVEATYPWFLEDDDDSEFADFGAEFR